MRDLPPELREALEGALVARLSGGPENTGPRNMSRDERAAALRASLETLNTETTLTPGMLIRRKPGLSDGYKNTDVLIYMGELSEEDRTSLRRMVENGSEIPVDAGPLVSSRDAIAGRLLDDGGMLPTPIMKQMYEPHPDYN